jgi:hypothetical protein
MLAAPSTINPSSPAFKQAGGAIRIPPGTRRKLRSRNGQW